MINHRFDLTRFRLLDRLLRGRWIQFFLRALGLAGFILAILAGILGTQVGSHNFSIVFVWVAWWSTLKLLLIPLGGRVWCSVCPLPLPGEWIQNQGILNSIPSMPQKRLKPFPKILRGAGVQSIAMLVVGLFSSLLLTSPLATSALLGVLLLFSLVLSLIYQGRAFCSHICPIGGFIGLYAQAAPLELRTKRVEDCAVHSQKTCFQVCPWGQYPLALKTSMDCGLCMECLRVCPTDNIALNLRPFGADLSKRVNRSVSQTLLGLIMLASVLVYTASFLGSFGWLKMAMTNIGSTDWFIYAGTFLIFSLVQLPAVYATCTFAADRLSGSKSAFRRHFTQFSPVLIPLGLMAWIAFTLSFALSKFDYLPGVIFDPFGWSGLQTSPKTTWITFPGQSLRTIQTILLAIGFYWSSRLSVEMTKSSKTALPLIGFNAIITFSMLWLLIG